MNYVATPQLPVQPMRRGLASFDSRVSMGSGQRHGAIAFVFWLCWYGYALSQYEVLDSKGAGCNSVEPRKSANR